MHNFSSPGYGKGREVTSMSKKKTKKQSPDLRLEPEKRLANKFDSASIAKFPVGSPGKMGFRVVDNCAEENQK